VDVAGAEEIVVIFLTAGRMASPAARRLLIPDDGFFPSSVRDDVVLLVTELLTNAVRHASGEPGRAMRVELRRWADFVRVEVFGEGAGFSADRPGLVLVDRIADRWPITRTASGTCVWFEIRTGDERKGDGVDPTGAHTGGRASVLKKAIALYAAFARKRSRAVV
jgi:two-component sensor histidine kinase